MSDTKSSRFEDDGESLKVLFEKIWRKRLKLFALNLLLLTIIVGLWMALPHFFPPTQTSVLPFRLQFEGASKGVYPSGEKFTREELLAVPVLQAAYDANSLQEFMPFEAFRKRVFVLENNEEFEILKREYLPRITDPKTSPAERTLLEREFQLKKDAVKAAAFELAFERFESGRHIPSSTLVKVLQDILRLWAEHAVKNKGVTQYSQIAILTPEALLPAEPDDEFIVRLDLFKQKFIQMREVVEQMLNLPNGRNFRTAPEDPSLAELQIQLRDLEQVKVNPLLNVVAQHGLARNGVLAEVYLRNRLGGMDEVVRNSRSKTNLYSEALQQYVGSSGKVASGPTVNVIREGRPEYAATPQASQSVIPQMDASFFDRLISISSHTGDQEYRQELVEQIVKEGLETVRLEKETYFYQRLLADYGKSKMDEAERKIWVEHFPQEIAEIEQALKQIMGQVQRSFELLSQKNLHPSTELYMQLAPVSHRSEWNMVSKRTLIMWAATVAFLANACLVLYILITAKAPETKRS